MYFILNVKMHEKFMLVLWMEMSVESLPPALTNRKVVSVCECVCKCVYVSCIPIGSTEHDEVTAQWRQQEWPFLTQRPVRLSHPHVTSLAPGCSVLFLCTSFFALVSAMMKLVSLSAFGWVRGVRGSAMWVRSTQMETLKALRETSQTCHNPPLL